jgi:DNA repair protein SbcC/Rad50
MNHAGEDHAVARKDLSDAQAAEALAKNAASEAKLAITSATEALNQHEARIGALEAPSKQADLALSDAARNLRLRLEPEVPCPVCGSTEHPIHADAALAELASRLRADLASARQSAQDARKAQSTAERQHAQAEAQIEQARNGVATANRRLEKTEGDWATARAEAYALPGCPELSERPGNDLTALQAARQQVLEAQTEVAEAQNNVAKLRKELTQSSERRETLRDLLKAKAAEQEQVANAKSQVDRDLVLARQAAQNHNALKDRYGAALAPLLASLEESPDSLSDPALSERLEALVNRVISARQAQTRAKDLLTELGPKIAGQTSKSEATAVTAERTRKEMGARQTLLDDLHLKRASLFGGEPTSVHRTRFNDSRKAALSLRDETQKAYAEAANQAVADATRHTSAESELAYAEEAGEAVNTQLMLALEDLHLSVETLEGLFASSRAELQTLRDHLRSLDDAVTAARAATAERRLDLAGYEKTLPQTPPEDLRAKLSELDEAETVRQQRRGAIESQITIHNENRLKLAELEVEITAARAELDVWQAVNAAVGSRNGDRFSRFAQSITLDVLANSANRHLVDLNPRYRLRRAADLALQVEDIDMGGEARAARSLSGGERFLVSLALALALSRMGGKGGLAATLFIDEGFGSLDATSLDLAINALEGLQSQGRQVGVISHVEAMKDRIPVCIMVSKQGGGKSAVRISGSRDV